MESPIRQVGYIKKARSANFTENEVKMLITVHNESRLSLNQSLTTTARGARVEIWNKIADAVTAVDGVHRTAYQCKNKLKNLSKANNTKDKRLETDLDDDDSVTGDIPLPPSGDIPQSRLTECLICSQLLNPSSVNVDESEVSQILTLDLVNSLCTVLSLRSTNLTPWKRILMNYSFCPSCYDMAVEAKKVLRLLDVVQNKVVDISSTIENAIRLGHSRGKAKSKLQPTRAARVDPSNDATSYTQIRLELLNALKQGEETEIDDHEGNEIGKAYDPVIVNIHSTGRGSKRHSLLNQSTSFTTIDIDSALEETLTDIDFTDTLNKITQIDPLSIDEDRASNNDVIDLCEEEYSNFDDADDDSKERDVYNPISIRAPNFTESEINMLWTQYKLFESKLQGLIFNNPTFQRIWRSIARKVNDCDDGTHKRTLKQCWKKVLNIKFAIAQGRTNRNTAPFYEIAPDQLSPGTKAAYDESGVDDELESEFDVFNDATGNQETYIVTNGKEASRRQNELLNITSIRSPNFTDMETKFLLEEYKRQESKDGLGGNKSQVQASWEAIVQKVNSCSDGSNNWTIKQCKKKIMNWRWTRCANTKIVTMFKDTKYNIETPSGAVELKHLSIKLTRCDETSEFLHPKNGFISSILSPSERIRKLKHKLSRRKRFSKSKIQERTNLILVALSRRKKKRIHIKTNEKPPEVESDDITQCFTCPSCTSKFSVELERDAHIKKKHEGITLPYNCTVVGCEKTFSSSIYLEKHVDRYHNGKAPPHRCDQFGCGIQFYTTFKLAQHKRRVHEEAGRKYTCDICPKRFSMLAYLKNHKAYSHDESRSFLCEVCSRSFKTKICLVGHQAKVHGDENPEKFKPELQTCSICGFRSTSRYYHKRHVQRHDGTSLRWACQEPNCIFRADRPYGLKLHMLSHTQERNFQCHLCPSAYKTKARLDYHILRHDGTTPHQCPECEKKFANTKSLHNHIAVIHKKETNLKCAACGEGFPVRKYLLRHLLICAEGYSGTSKRYSTTKAKIKAN